jgi:hypothetical protein
MGQYHHAVNLDKGEYLSPHALGNGLKLWEQAYGNRAGVGSALIVLLAVSAPDGGRGGGDPRIDDPNGVLGRWGGDRVVIVGDYAASDDFPGGDAKDIYEHLNSDHPEAYKDITPLVADYLERWFEGKYIGQGWKDFVAVDDEVRRWYPYPATAVSQQITGRVLEVSDKIVKVDWGANGGVIEHDAKKPEFFT